MAEIYISVDIEANGPIPGIYSMLSYGAAAFQLGPDGEDVLLGTYTDNLETLGGAIEDPDTMRWWSEPKQRAAWVACRINPIPPKTSMLAFVKWIENLPGIEKDEQGRVKNAVFVGYPAGFDFTFVYYYLIYFAGRSPFTFSALDIKSFAMAVLGTDFRRTIKSRMPREWFPEDKHTHVALDDAIEQGRLFLNILRASRAKVAKSAV